MLDITFHVQCSTRPGENIWLVGSSSQLGNWVPQNGIQLKTTPDVYPIWKSESVSLPNDVEYKYFVAGADSKPRWEPCPNRRIPKTHGRIHGATLHEIYGRDPTKNTWWTEASKVTECSSSTCPSPSPSLVASPCFFPPASPAPCATPSSSSHLQTCRDADDRRVTEEIPWRLRDVDVFKLLVVNAGLEQELAKVKADLAKAHEEIVTLKSGGGCSKGLAQCNPSSCIFIDLCAQDVDEADAEYYPDHAICAAHEQVPTKDLRRKESSHDGAQNCIHDSSAVASSTTPELRKLEFPLDTQTNQLKMAHSPRRGSPRGLKEVSAAQVLDVLLRPQESKTPHSHDVVLCAEEERTAEKRRLQKSNAAPLLGKALPAMNFSKLQETNQLKMAHSPRRGTPRGLSNVSLAQVQEVSLTPQESKAPNPYGDMFRAQGSQISGETLLDSTLQGA
eukprot:gnl/MRDRNA2_/MRDRNA2_27325_c0_seq2.p1 gnl/MRDRNA2_/MRDRNA2_27325_c0~~gnl/MRDRNA2_/MRDRNA2_27325_c0_seq2.p1  ORF type:complete len:448 (-),score=86.86 gnl/MRDRNA2_/MRDRNA2_27325_c0_seq2:680-2023(-)